MWLDADTLFHADWSKHPRKRFHCVARRSGTCWTVEAPLRGLLHEQLTSEALSGKVVAGFDFPVGVPEAWGRNTGLTDFPALLGELGKNRWADFYEVARVKSEIRLERPFYPFNNKNGERRAHLEDALGVDGPERLYRRCERATGERQAASPLFWTSGAKQVGKAAIAGWRDIVVPCVEEGAALWPFADDETLRQAQMVIVETYPAEVYGHLGIRFGSGMSKTSQQDRATFIEAISDWRRKRPVVFSSDLQAEIDSGFGSRSNGEDKFDAFVGLCGMIMVELGEREPGAPIASAVRKWEGWILGQHSPI